jgi:hypothetical protein
MELIEIILYILLAFTLAWYIFQLIIIIENQRKITRNQSKIMNGINDIKEKLK